MADINVKVSFGATAESAQSTAEEALRYGQQTLLPLINTNQANIATNKTAIATNATNIATNKTAIATNATNIATNKTNIAVLDELADIHKELNKIQLLFKERQLYVEMPFYYGHFSRMTFNFSLMRSTNGTTRYTYDDAEINTHFRRGRWTDVNVVCSGTIQLEGIRNSDTSHRFVIRVKGMKNSKEYYDYPGTYRAPRNLGEDLECTNRNKGNTRICFFQGQYIDGRYNYQVGYDRTTFRDHTFFQKFDWKLRKEYMKSKNVKLGLKVSIIYTATDGSLHVIDAPILPFAIKRWYDIEKLSDPQYAIPRFTVGRWAY